MSTKSPRNKTLDLDLADIPQAITDKILTAKDNLGDLSSVINRSINGDSFEIMEKLPQQFVNLALVDPPYNLTKTYEDKVFNARSVSEYQEFTREWISRLKPLLKPNATVYVFSDWRTSMDIAPLLQENFLIQNRITWQREKGRGAKTNYKNGMEDIWFLTNAKDYTFNVDAIKQRRKVIAPYKEDGKAKDWEETPEGNFRDTAPSNFWDDISIPYWSMPENTAHPTQKPEKLMAKVILASSNKDDIIFDPFSGSGSSLVTAKKLGRRYLGIEQSLQYTAWGEIRLERAESDRTIQGYTDGVFWERNTLAEQKKYLSKNLKNNVQSQTATESAGLF